MPQIVPFIKAAVAAWRAWAAANAVMAFVIKTAVVMAATSAVSRMLYKGPSVTDMMSAVKNRGLMSRQSDFPRRIIYGRVRVSGPMIFLHETGAKRQYIQLIVPVASHKCAGYDKLWLGDQEVTVNSGGDILTGPYAGLGRIIFHDGDPNQNADTSLMAIAPGLWTANHRGRGIAYFYIQLEWRDEVWSSGLPNFAARVLGKLVYDPRDGVTKYSTNAGLCTLDYLTSTTYGPGISLAKFHTATLTATLNNCDEDVALAAGGSEKRYTINGDVTLDQSSPQIIAALLTSMGGSLDPAGGKWYLRSAMWRAATRTALTVDDLRGPIDLAPRISRRDLVNFGKGTYVSEADNWQVTDFPPYGPPLYQAEDGGIRLPRDFTYPFTLSPSTARRLTKIGVERNRQQQTVRWPGKLQVMDCQVGEVVPITHERFGWTNKLFEVVAFKWVLYEAGEGKDSGSMIGCDLTLRETASGCFDWNNGDDVTVDLAPNTNLPDPSNVIAPVSVTCASGSPHGFIQEDGTFVARLHVTWPLPNDIYVESGGKFRIEYKLVAAPMWIEWPSVDGTKNETYITGLVIGAIFQVRVRSENHYGWPSAWVQAADHTLLGDTIPPAVPTGLTASPKAGYTSLTCNTVTDADMWEYSFYRNTVNTFGTSVWIGDNRTPWFDDATGTPGTNYFYWVLASDRSENASTQSNVASAVMLAPPPDDSAPPAPSAATITSTSTYDGGDGTVYAQAQLSIPATPAGAGGTEIVYRKVGTNDWRSAGSIKNAALAAFTIDDLSSGVPYDIGTRTTQVRIKSAVVPCVGSPIAGVFKTAGPANPSNFAGHAPGSSYPLPPRYDGVNPLVGATITFDESPDKDVAYYNVWVHNSTVFPPAFGPTHVVTRGPVLHYQILPLVSYVWASVVGRSGNQSTPFYTGVGLFAFLGASGGNLGLQNANDVDVSAIRTGAPGASSTKEILCLYHDSIAPGLTAGQTFVDISISNRGFSAPPDSGSVTVTFPHNEVQACYYPNDVNNTSTNARIHFTPAIPSNGSREIDVHLVETF